MAAADKQKFDSIARLMVIANDYSGGDIGAKINAADAAFAGVPANIFVLPANYTIATQVVLGAGHRLVLGDGIYDNSMTTTSVFTMKDNTEISSARRWGAQIKETINRAGGVTTAINDFNDNEHAGNVNLVVRGLAFLQKAADPDGVSATVQFGNATDVEVDDCHWENTSGFCVCVGGKANNGFHASGIRITDNRMQLAGTQNIAVVNGYNLLIDANVMVGGGAGGRDKSTFIDVELNSEADRCDNFSITNNIIDARGGVPSVAGTAIQVVGEVGDPGAKNVTVGIIAHNKIIGGPLDELTGPSITGGISVILVDNVAINDNVLRYIGQVGITLSSSDNCTVSDNHVIDCGPAGPIPQTITISGSRWCTVKNNHLSTQVGGGYYAGIYEDAQTTYGVAADYNYIYGNRLYFSPGQSISNPLHELRITLTGSHSREWHNEVNGETWGVPGVSTVAQLTAGFIPGLRASGVPALANVLGRAAIADVQPMLFKYDPASTATVNGLTVLKPANATNGRWLWVPDRPRMTSTERDAITLTAADFGFQILNTTNNKRQEWDGSGWQNLW